MQFTDIPEEILIIIIRKLDAKSQHSLYNTCKVLRNVVCMQGVLKRCCFSLNTMATANALKSNFFEDIHYNLLELNMSGVVDLCKSKLFPALKKLKRLKVLDVSFTEVTMDDLIPIHELCPTINDITINFVWKCKSFVVPSSILLPCQKVFEKFENVKFVGSFDNLVYSRLIVYLLEKAKLNQLKLVVINAPFVRKSTISTINYPVFNYFVLNVLDCNFGSTVTALSEHWANSYILSMLLLMRCDYIILLTFAFDVKVYASTRFISYFKDMYQIKVDDTPLPDIEFLVDVPRLLYQNTGVLLMVWNELTTVFDEKFYDALTKHVKQYLPYKFEFQLEREVPPKNKYELFYISPVPYYSKKDEVVDSHSIKRKRVAAPNFVLNYDILFMEEEKISLVVHFKHPLYSGVALTDGCMYLRKLTYLSLIDIGRYSFDFFKVLFRSCVNLVTLNVRSPSSTQCASAISYSIALSKSLKNLRISENMIDFDILFLSLSQCTSLENIHISENLVASANCEYNQNHLGNPSLLVEVLDQLYNVYVEAPLSESAVKKSVLLFNRTKKKYNKHHIRFEVNSTNKKGCRYYPFASVFKLSAITTV